MALCALYEVITFTKKSECRFWESNRSLTIDAQLKKGWIVSHVGNVGNDSVIMSA
eukprot:m.15081 g.15081  ORF g.15081 m.15081 type:complete len:55 (+) comp26166_c0_seq1:214-378(+)